LGWYVGPGAARWRRQAAKIGMNLVEVDETVEIVRVIHTSRDIRELF
jgi:plasmid stabilization system protein ParE